MTSEALVAFEANFPSLLGTSEIYEAEANFPSLLGTSEIYEADLYKGGQSPEIMGTEVQTKRRTFERRFLSTAVAGNLNCKMGMLKIFEFSCSWHPYGAS